LWLNRRVLVSVWGARGAVQAGGGVG